jgi:hypothetical protein
MGKMDVYNIGTAAAQSAGLDNVAAAFAEGGDVAAQSAHFPRGANMDGNMVKIGQLRVSGDITGFRNIQTRKLNSGGGFSSHGSIIADRATIGKSVNVSKNMTLKSDALRTISGFVGMRAHSIATPFINAENMIFNGNFGLTVSGELLYSTSAPLKIGSWVFPSYTPPRFTKFRLSRAAVPPTPTTEFDKIIQEGWKEAGSLR